MQRESRSNWPLASKHAAWYRPMQASSHGTILVGSSVPRPSPVGCTCSFPSTTTIPTNCSRFRALRHLPPALHMGACSGQASVCPVLWPSRAARPPPSLWLSLVLSAASGFALFPALVPLQSTVTKCPPPSLALFHPRQNRRRLTPKCEK